MAENTPTEAQLAAARHHVLQHSEPLPDLVYATIWRAMANAAWQPIETAPAGDELFLAHGDGKTMVFKGSILAIGRRPGTPSHLTMGWATHWMPLPTPPKATPAPTGAAP